MNENILNETDNEVINDATIHKKRIVPTEVLTKVLIKWQKMDEDILNEMDNKESDLASYAHLQELLNEKVRLPVSYKQKNEVRRNASTCKKWVVGTINISKRFREYQMKAPEKAKTEGLKYDDT
ncbi:unnamed protein product [Rhizophagus irregularis]|nr:unnamed protein product [Rhizophagus irregularis]